MNYAWPLLAFGVAWLATRALAGGALAGLAMDMPNQRSLHAVPIPRTGGLAVFVAVLLAWGTGGYAAQYAALVACTAALVALSFADDVRGLSVLWRLLGHVSVSAAFAYAYCGDAGIGGPVGLAVLLLAMVWMTNLYNFMDGADGLAAGMALIGFSAYGIAAALAGASPIAVMSFVLAAAAAGFLPFNFHPARIFLGDAGSIPLGFLAGALGILGWREGLWPSWFPLLVFSPFIADATATLCRRAWRGAKVWQAHREHYYQRVVRMGWGHGKTALAEYALMAAVAASAVLMRGADPVALWSILAAWFCAYGAIMLTIDALWRVHGDGK